MQKLSFSITEGPVSEKRLALDPAFRAKREGVDPGRTPLNVTLVDRSIEEVYHELFDEALAAYNEAKRTKGHARAQIPDYLSHIRAGKQERPSYELVIQLGNLETNPATSADCRSASEAVYRDLLPLWTKRFPQHEIVTYVIHMDQATPHAHLEYVPWANGCGRGLETRNTKGGAMRQMGFPDSLELRDAMFATLGEAARRHGIERLLVSAPWSYHLTLDEYRHRARSQQRLVAFLATALRELSQAPGASGSYADALGKVADLIEEGGWDAAAHVVGEAMGKAADKSG